jgi:hypothetical protein
MWIFAIPLDPESARRQPCPGEPRDFAGLWKFRYLADRDRVTSHDQRFLGFLRVRFHASARVTLHAKRSAKVIPGQRIFAAHLCGDSAVRMSRNSDLRERAIV